jgi:FkbM family methyltransferase
VGAFDGITDDPLGPFARHLGWEGILVEPQPHLFSQLMRNLNEVPNLHFENAAIAPHTGTATMYYVRRDLSASDHAGGVDFTRSKFFSGLCNYLRMRA